MDRAMTEKSYTQRRACALAGIDPRVYRRRSKRPADTALRARMKELASERRRFGYRRLHILLKREGWEVNWKKLYRLYREEGLTVRKRGGRKRAVGTRTPMAIPPGPNQRPLSADFALQNRLPVNGIARLHVRRAVGWPPVPHPLRDRRLQPGMPCNGRGHVDPGHPGGARAGSDHRDAGPPLHGGLRQPLPDRRFAKQICREGHRADIERHAQMAGGSTCGMALHRTGQADAERLRGKLQWPPAGRMSQRAPLLDPSTIGLEPMAPQRSTMPAI